MEPRLWMAAQHSRYRLQFAAGQPTATDAPPPSDRGLFEAVESTSLQQHGTVPHWFSLTRSQRPVIHRQAAWWNGSRKRVSEGRHPDPWLYSQDWMSNPERQMGRVAIGIVALPSGLKITPQLCWWGLQRVHHCCSVHARFLGKETKIRFLCYGIFSSAI